MCAWSEPEGPWPGEKRKICLLVELVVHTQVSSMAREKTSKLLWTWLSTSWNSFYTLSTSVFIWMLWWYTTFASLRPTYYIHSFILWNKSLLSKFAVPGVSSIHLTDLKLFWALVPCSASVSASPPGPGGGRNKSHDLNLLYIGGLGIRGS